MERQIAQPPVPRLIHTYDDDGRGGWYAGAVDWPDAPVVVFVPGLGQPARSFWDRNETYGQNELYARVTADGYRTAFVGFAAEKQKPMDMWHNGRILAWQLADICAYFHIPAVTLVAHSKGGVDAQTAAVYYGAAEYIRALYTLSSPHWGSELADLAYSSVGFSLGERMGVHSDGCYVMQTGYMRAFREKTDTVGRAVPLFTFGGRGSGPAFSRVWAGGQILSHWGENDGVVTVRSAHHPFGEHLATLDFDHIQMQAGQFVWPHVRTALEGRQTVGQPAAVPVSASVRGDAAAGLVLRGGGLADGVQETFAVDSTAAVLQVCLMTAGDDGFTDRFSLTAPDGMVVPFREAHTEDAAQMLCAKIRKPSPGRWTLHGQKGSGAYLASVRLEPARTAVSAGRHAVRGLRRVLRIFQTFPDHCQLVYEGEAAKDGRIPVPLGNGIFSIEQVLRGVLDDGSPYERNIVESLIRNAWH